MTYQHDRTYWRQCSTRTLLEAALQSRDELTIALGERLEEYEFQEATIDGLISENVDLRSMVQSLEEDNKYTRAELEELRDAMDLH